MREFESEFPKNFLRKGLMPESRRRSLTPSSFWKKTRATVIPINLIHSPYAIGAYYLIATAEASSNLARL